MRPPATIGDPRVRDRRPREHSSARRPSRNRRVQSVEQDGARRRPGSRRPRSRPRRPCPRRNSILIAGADARRRPGHASRRSRGCGPVLRQVRGPGGTACSRDGPSVYAHDATGDGDRRRAPWPCRASTSRTASRTAWDVIDPRTYRVIAPLRPSGPAPAPACDSLVGSEDAVRRQTTSGNSLTPINPTDRPHRGGGDSGGRSLQPLLHARRAIGDRGRRTPAPGLDFPQSPLVRAAEVAVRPLSGIDHMDFTADGRVAIASCEFSGQLVRIDSRGGRRVNRRAQPCSRGRCPRTFKLSPGRPHLLRGRHDGPAGLWEISARRFPHGRVSCAPAPGAHGLYPSRDARLLYVSNRGGRHDPA